MRKLLPVLLALFGLGAGVGAGLLLKPAPELITAQAAAAMAGGAAYSGPEPPPGGAEVPATENEYVRLNNQFVVPVVAGGKVTSLVVMSISLQVTSGAREQVFSREPKLRDSFLQVLFDHANTGGFDGIFTTSENLRALRMALLEAARKAMGDMVSDVLIIDLMRQDT